MAIEIKDNGLPVGSGLYWKDHSRSQIWIRISHNGIAKSYPSGTAEWKKAIQVRDKLRADLVKGAKRQIAGAAVRIDDLLDDYIVELRRKSAARGAYGTENPGKVENACKNHIRPFFGKLKASALTTADLNRYSDQRVAAYRTAGKPEGSWTVAINRDFAYLRAAYRLGMRSTPPKVSGYPHFPIDAKGERLRTRTGIITAKQFDLLMATAADHLKPVLALITYGGLRSKEVRFVRREQVDWSNMLIHLRQGETKAGPGRDVPIVDVAVEPLRKWMDYSAQFFPECPWLFHFAGRQITTWRTAWDAACRRAGLTTPVLDGDGKPKIDKRGKPVMRNVVRPHDARRTAITIQGRAGVTEADSQRVTGHDTVQVHRKYDQDKDAAVRTREAINAYLSPPPEAKPAPPAISPFAGMSLQSLLDAKREGLLTDAEFASAKRSIFSTAK